jgi:hypothetical protein
MTGRTKEYVCFRMISMPCCGHLLCWLNERFPLYCPECGTFVLSTVKGGGGVYG